MEVSLDLYELIGVVMGLLATGGATLWRTIIYLADRFEKQLQEIADKMDERHKNIHEKIDGKCDALNKGLIERTDTTHARINAVERNGREDVKDVSKRIDDLMFQFME